MRSSAVAQAALLVDTVAALSCIGISTLVLLSKGLESQSMDQESLEDSNEFIWSVSTVTSLIPVFNWLTWILPALESKQPARFYLFAAIYAIPVFVRGLPTGEVEPTTIALYILCALHLQVELAAATNPQPVIKALNSAPKLRDGVQEFVGTSSKYLGWVSEALKYSVNSAADEQAQFKSLEEKRRVEQDIKSQQQLRQLETEAWDSKLQDRQNRGNGGE